MSEWRLLRWRGAQEVEVWPLPPQGRARIGRAVSNSPSPEVDLSPDPSVSASHATLWWMDGHWWLKEAADTAGLRLNGREIRGEGAVPVDPGQVIGIGETALVLADETWHCLQQHDWRIDLSVAPAISYSLAHCGAP
ncbi:MAG: FHA domain-containing protein, partial [Proteobacteria bacterium]|nr:FHA domain-containing protein [Pseudomonadota bacterium]